MSTEPSPTAAGSTSEPGAPPAGSGLLARIGPAHRWRAVLRAEVRKTTSLRLYWLLLIPVVLLTLFGSLIVLLLPSGGADTAPVLLAGLASMLSWVSIIGGVFGALTASGEYRYRTVTQAFLTGTRGQTLGSKVVVVGVVAVGYGLVAALLGILLVAVVLGGGSLPSAGSLIGLGLVGMLVCALWGMLGVAIGTLVSNQAGAVTLVVGYLLIGENLLSWVMSAGNVSSSDPSVFARLTSFLPSNAGDIALYESPARAALGGGGPSAQVLEQLAGVSAPPPGWVALLVLLAWTVAGVALATVLGGRRDIT